MQNKYMTTLRFLSFYSFLSVLAFFSTPAYSQVSISVGIAPPPLVVETQPACPDDGYLWTPGYWAYDPDAGEYYWVPGAWVQPPQIGFLWTPCYWGWDNGAYAFHQGYWGSSVGFYGGINYGHGYWGHGYGGGRWEGGHFAYNTAANNVRGGQFHNTYVDHSVVRSTSTRVSYNGGHGGITARPTAHERQVAQQSHVPATSQQTAHFQSAAQTRSHQVKVNNSAVAGNNNATHTAPAIDKHDAAFTGGDIQSHRTAEQAAKTETAATTHRNETHVASQHAVSPNSEVAATHHVQKASQTHVAQAAVHPAAQAQHVSAPAAVHHSQASVPHTEHATAPHMSAPHAASAPHASTPHAGGGGHSGGGNHASAGGNKH